DVQKHTLGAVLYGESLPGIVVGRLIKPISVVRRVFVGFPVPEDPGFSLGMHVRYDEIDNRQLAERYALSRSVVEEKNDGAEQMTSEEKEPAKQIANLLFDMLGEGIEVGRLDAYGDMTATQGGTHVVVAGIRAANGKKADEIVQLIPQANTDWSVELNV